MKFSYRKRLDGVIADIDKKQNEHRDTLITLQKSLQEASVHSEMKG